MKTQSSLNPTYSTDPEKKQKLIETLASSDEQFRNAFPLKEVAEAKTRKGLRIAQVVKIVMEGYANRPALGQRARELVSDPETGRKTLELLPTFETLSYAQLWEQARALANDWHNNTHYPLEPRDMVCLLGFTSPQYAAMMLAIIHLGGVKVPLQTSAPTTQHADIINETEACVLGTGIDYIDAAVNAVLAAPVPKRLIIFDYDARDDDHRERLAAARKRIADAGFAITVDTFDDLVESGKRLPDAPLYLAEGDEDPITSIFYTSGSTGTPKGAVFNESLDLGTWLSNMPTPAITLSFMPMAHLVGNGYLLLALANGGTSYCSPKADLSTLFEDFSLARPTMASIVPRVCELLYHHYLGELDRRVASGAQEETTGDEIKREMREKMMGGRLLSVGCGSASLAPETYAFMESMLDMHMPIGYSSTEIAGGTVLVDWKIQRPPVIDYKLDDVPELGYFGTDKPYPRGELLVKTDRFMRGYYKQPDLTAEKVDADGFYRTGDIMAQIAPDELVYLDRRNNVLKLSQGEFVAVSKLEALYSHSPQISQIYIYGNSERAFLLAVIVPSSTLSARIEDAESSAQVKSIVRDGLKQVAKEHNLVSYEIPRDFLIETEPFSLKNGLLSEVGKSQRPKLKARYGEALEELYARMAQDQLDELSELRRSGGSRPTLETVSRALQATLGISSADVQENAQFAELGGDSLSALAYSILLEDIFEVEVPVGVIISPAGSIRQLVKFIEKAREAGGQRISFGSVHDTNSAKVHASELKLEKFIDRQQLANATSLPPATGQSDTVFLTGSTGFLGRFLALAWLERMAERGGRLVLIARGTDDAQARQRIEQAFASDPELLAHFKALAADHLEVVPGDLGMPGLGLDGQTWERLADTVDLIVHCAAHVNHVLPYDQLFPANVAGTAELIRLAISGKRKRIDYISTLGVSALSQGKLVNEDGDIRELVPSAELNDHYANGYNVSKWASEVLLREAGDLLDLPVNVFRPGMILAHSQYRGQLNVPDMFTRLLFSLAITGVAPTTFYAEDLSAGHPRGRYEGFSVDFLANVITAIGARATGGYHSYNLSSPHKESGLDEFVDWMIDAGCSIERVKNYSEWLEHFETAMQALPERQRNHSMLALLQPYRKPQISHSSGGVMQTSRFVEAAEASNSDIPSISPELIKKYINDLRYLELL